MRLQLIQGSASTSPLAYWLAFAVPAALLVVAVIACLPLISAILGGDAVESGGVRSRRPVVRP